jgi:hypothetical protein
MPRSLIRLFSLLLAVVFTANALVPGQMHGCGRGDAVLPGATMAMGGGMHHAMAMDGDEAANPTPGHERQGQPGPMDDCHCIGHACCASGVVVPTVPTFAVLWSVEVPRSVEALPGSTPATRPEHLLPLSHAPPALLS